jgi:hypothetical protein
LLLLPWLLFWLLLLLLLRLIKPRKRLAILLLLLLIWLLAAWHAACITSLQAHAPAIGLRMPTIDWRPLH